MPDAFDLYPEFISTDIRTTRTGVSYPVTTELMQHRHKHMLDTINLKGKSVLDLGCCVAATGAWCLHAGAARYVGIEIDQGFVQQAEANLSNRFAEGDWQIIRSSIEDYLQNCSERFDVVIASGIIYAVTDVEKFLTKVCNLADVIIVESVHPLEDWREILKNCLPKEAVDLVIKRFDPTWLFEEFAITVLRKNYMVKGNSGTYYDSYGSYPSKKMLDCMFQSLGFREDISLRGKMEQALPDLYGVKRFAVRYLRDSSTLPVTTVQSLAERS